MADTLTFAGNDLTQYVFVEKAPKIVHAQRDERTYVIPGRSGTYKEQLDTYRNYIQEYEVIGGGNAARVNGNTTVNVTSANITGNVYGGGNNAEVSGNTNVNIGAEAP